ncbi:hypothetical protein ABDB91_11645 [Desulfoscipio sp. XC116]|uniref:hypothetical protein n=1 Tax=Desulfoscipio sp. XC116 TaxID=3144975 RepID=UPI00325B0D7C
MGSVKKSELDELRDAIIELQNKVAVLEENQLRLRATKLSDSSYPYWNYLLGFGIRDEVRRNIEYALFILSERLSGNNIIMAASDELSDKMLDSDDIYVTKNKANLYPKELFDAGIPTYKDTVNIIMKIMEIDDEVVVFDLLLSIYWQSMFKELMKHLLIPNLK